MTALQLNQAPVMKTAMRIRKSPAEVFEAFVDPALTAQFWFTKGSARLEAGKQVQWAWEMYGFSIPVDVKALEPGRRILIAWPSAGGPTTVEWIFKPLKDGTTFVEITNAGFAGSGDEQVKQALDSTQGFSLLLAGAKAFLEHGIRLNLVIDHTPGDLEIK